MSKKMSTPRTTRFLWFSSFPTLMASRVAMTATRDREIPNHVIPLKGSMNPQGLTSGSWRPTATQRGSTTIEGVRAPPWPCCTWRWRVREPCPPPARWGIWSFCVGNVLEMSDAILFWGTKSLNEIEIKSRKQFYVINGNCKRNVLISNIFFVFHPLIQAVPTVQRPSAFSWPQLPSGGRVNSYLATIQQGPNGHSQVFVIV